MRIFDSYVPVPEGKLVINELNQSIYTWQMSGGVLQDSTLQFFDL